MKTFESTFEDALLESYLNPNNNLKTIVFNVYNKEDRIRRPPLGVRVLSIDLL